MRNIEILLLDETHLCDINRCNREFWTNSRPSCASKNAIPTRTATFRSISARLIGPYFWRIPIKKLRVRSSYTKTGTLTVISKISPWTALSAARASDANCSPRRRSGPENAACQGWRLKPRISTSPPVAYTNLAGFSCAVSTRIYTLAWTLPATKLPYTGI